MRNCAAGPRQARCCPASTSASSARPPRRDGRGHGGAGWPHPLQKAFADLGAAQCGYCTDSRLRADRPRRRAYNPKPDAARDPQRARGQPLPVHRARQDLEAVELAAAWMRANVEAQARARSTGSTTTTADCFRCIPGVRRGGRGGRPMTERRRTRVVGRPYAKVDAAAKVTGQTRFADDIVLPRMLALQAAAGQGRPTRGSCASTPRRRRPPGCRGRGHRRDLPIPFGILPVSQDEHALCADRVRFVGDPVAAVAAVTRTGARDALEAIEVEYERLPPIGSIEDGLRALRRLPSTSYGDSGNIHKLVAMEFGDTGEGFSARADRVYEDLFFYEGNTHLPLEQHAAVADFGPDGKLTLWSSTQTPHYVHRALAKALEMPAAKIRVIATPNGGGFGGKSDPFNHEIVVAHLSRATGRPVKICLTREEVFYCHRGRHPTLMKLKTGVQSDGSITADAPPDGPRRRRLRSYGVASTYYTGALQTVTYAVPAYRFDGARVLHQQAALRAQAGPRYAAAAFCAGGAARQDRLRPRPRPGRHSPRAPAAAQLPHREFPAGSGRWASGPASTRSSRPPAGRERRGKLPPGRGLGLACSSYLCGAGLPIYWNAMPQSGVQLKLDRSGGVTVFCGSTDIGQGSDSILAAIVAEVLGVDLFDIRIVTRRHGPDAGRSRLLLLAGHAHDGQRGDPGGRARAGNARRGRGGKARHPAGARGAGRGTRLRRRGPGRRMAVRRGRRARGVEIRHARHGRLLFAAALGRAATAAPASDRRRPTPTRPPSSKSTSTRRPASTPSRRSGSPTTSASASTRCS